MITACDCYLLDENSGEFVADGGRVVKYHNARFYDLESRRVFKAGVSADSPALPEPMLRCKASFEVNAGERFCRLSYLGCKA